MSPAARLICSATVLGALSLATAARADQASSQSCARALPPEAMTIYRTLAPQVTPSTDLMSLVKSQVKAMVMNGQVERATARSSARAAYPCLKDLK
jgi:type II secretory pathway component PulL